MLSKQVPKLVQYMLQLIDTFPQQPHKLCGHVEANLECLQKIDLP
jgi:regulator of sirC expression with transglutaminase-like and TPR domain